MNLIGELQQWYESQCNGDWEHHFGVTVGTLDNPGWTVTIDLQGTELEARAFHTIERLESEREWLKCWVEDSKFNAVGGPQQLEKILSIFLTWSAQTH